MGGRRRATERGGVETVGRVEVGVRVLESPVGVSVGEREEEAEEEVRVTDAKQEWE